MYISAEERIMYNVMRALYDSGIPIDFKGSMVLKACLVENGFSENTRHTVDIDGNWYTEEPPTKDQMIDSIQRALDEHDIPLNVDIYRMYGEKCSAGFELRHKETDELLFTMDIDVNRPMTQTRLYEVEGVSFRGVVPNQMIADKLAVLSSEKIFRRIKDLVDMYYISKVFEFNPQEILEVLEKSERELGDFKCIKDRVADLEHSYDKFRFTGEVDKPAFADVYKSVVEYIAYFI